MNTLISLLFLTSSILIAGCAGAPPSSSPITTATAPAASVTKIYINDVSSPPKMHYLGPGGVTFLAVTGGLVGALATAPELSRRRESFQEATAGKGLGINQIVREEVEAAARRSGKFAIADERGPDVAEFTIVIRQYGFSIPNGFSSSLVPILDITCDLTIPGQGKIWSNQRSVRPLLNPVEGRSVEDIRDKSAVREASLREAAKALAAKIIASYP